MLVNVVVDDCGSATEPSPLVLEKVVVLDVTALSTFALVLVLALLAVLVLSWLMVVVEALPAPNCAAEEDVDIE